MPKEPLGSILGARFRSGRFVTGASAFGRRSCPGGGLKRAALWVTGLVAVVTVVAACGSGSHRAASQSPPTTAAASPATPVTDTNGTMTYALSTVPTNWNVDAAGGNTASLRQIMAQIWPSVFVLGPDATEVLNSTFVTSAVQTRSSPQTVVYRINPKATWSDGQPITYRDFVYNWEARSGQARFHDVARRGHTEAFTPASTAGYSQIQSVSGKAAQPYVVTVVFKSPYPAWKTLFADLVPAHIAQKVGFDHGFTDPVADLVSGGPFEVVSYRPGQSLTVVRNPSYWGLPAKLQSITYRFVPDQVALAEGLDNGQLGAAYLSCSQSLAGYLSHVSGLTSDDQPGVVYQDLSFDEHNSWLADPRLRKAVMLAINRKQLVHQTVGKVVSATVPQEDRFFLPGEAGYQDNGKAVGSQGSLSQAKRLLTRAGYTLTGGSQPVLSKDGRVVSLTLGVSAGDRWGSQMIAPISHDLARLGITIETSSSSASTGSTNSSWAPSVAPSPQTSEPFDLTVTELDALDVSGQANALYGPGNASGYQSTAMDSLLRAASRATTVPQLDGLDNRIDQLAWTDAVDLPLAQNPTLLVYSNSYVGLTNNPAGGPASDQQDWGLKATT